MGHIKFEDDTIIATTFVVAFVPSREDQIKPREKIVILNKHNQRPDDGGREESKPKFV